MDRGYWDVVQDVHIGLSLECSGRNIGCSMGGACWLGDRKEGSEKKHRKLL